MGSEKKLWTRPQTNKLLFLRLLMNGLLMEIFFHGIFITYILRVWERNQIEKNCFLDSPSCALIKHRNNILSSHLKHLSLSLQNKMCLFTFPRAIAFKCSMRVIFQGSASPRQTGYKKRKDKQFKLEIKFCLFLSFFF